MRQAPSFAVTLLALTAAVAGCELGAEGHNLRISLGRQASETFEWHGRVAPGHQVEIKGVNGPVSARAADGDQVVVTAERSGFRSDPDEVRIEVVEYEGGVTICAVYPAGANECLPGDAGRLRSRNNDVKVEFDVAVPAGVDFIGRTVNGGVRAVDLGGDIEARTVNGSVTISTAGHARAKTVNGSIRASLGSGDWDGDTAFETVNGSVTLTLPASIEANLEARTSNGRITSELPMEVTRSSRRRLEGRLSSRGRVEGQPGDGGRTLLVKTTNGSIRLDSGD